MSSVCPARGAPLVLALLPLALGCGSRDRDGPRAAAPPRPGPVARPGLSRDYPPSPPAVAVLAPAPGEEILEPEYHGMKGVVDRLPEGCGLWVFARDRYRWYLQYPPPDVGGDGRFSQVNVRLATEGPWQLWVCVAPAGAGQRLHASARHGDWGFVALPEGCEKLASVAVRRSVRSPASGP